MSAKRKLNVAFFNGALIVAALFGLAAQSLGAFAVVLAVLVIASFYTGDMRR